jgi:aspartate aminotransferase
MKKMIEESGTLAVFDRMKKLRAMGKDIINLCVGEPDISPSQDIETAAIQAIQSHHIRYTPSEGIPELRKTIAHMIQYEGWRADENRNLIITAGAKPALFTTLLALVKKTNEVLVPVPFYPSYAPMIRYAGAKPVYVPGNPQNGYKTGPQDLKPYLTPHSRFFILNSPVNPTGSVYSPDELQELLKFLDKNHIICILDDVYRHFIYDEAVKEEIARILKPFQRSIILIRSLSKEFAMTGWRIGYAVAEESLITPMKTVQGHIIGNAQTASQLAALKALQNPEKYALPLYVFKSRRNDVLEALRQVDHISIIPPAGAFYVFADIRSIHPEKSDVIVCSELMEKYGVAVTPGSAFGLKGFIRISYADGNRLYEGLDRLVRGLASR